MDSSRVDVGSRKREGCSIRAAYPHEVVARAKVSKAPERRPKASRDRERSSSQLSGITRLCQCQSLESYSVTIAHKHPYLKSAITCAYSIYLYSACRLIASSLFGMLTPKSDLNGDRRCLEILNRVRLKTILETKLVVAKI